MPWPTYSKKEKKKERKRLRERHNEVSADWKEPVICGETDLRQVRFEWDSTDHILAPKKKTFEFHWK